MLIDIGVNFSNSRFDNDRPEVLQRARDAGIEKLILTGTSVSESESIVALCREFSELFPDMLYATAGIHPHDAKSLNKESIGTLKALADEKYVVAIGEMGLDFNRQLQILRTYRDHLVDAVTHCFTGTREALYGYLDLDMHIGITGWVCDDKRGAELQGLVADIPLQRLMVETDAPYLIPKTMPEPPKGKRNEPAFLPWVISKIAEQRNESAEELAQQTSDNSLRFFRLG